MSEIVFISLSSNLKSSSGSPVQNLARGLELIGEQAEILGLSRRYVTTPVGVKQEMPDFLNQVVRIKWQGKALELLHFVLSIEAKLGRSRSQDQSLGPLARTLDLDLLLFGKEAWSLPELVVPHPRMFERAFVLVPLLEIWQEDDAIPGQINPREFLTECMARLDCKIDYQHITQNN